MEGPQFSNQSLPASLSALSEIKLKQIKFLIYLILQNLA